MIAGGLSVAAIVTRAGATPLASLPPIAGTIAGWLLLTYLVVRGSAAGRAALDAAHDATPRAEAARGSAHVLPRDGDRRGIRRLVGIGARVLNATTSSIAAVRKALKLPEPTSTVVVPEGAELDIPGISPLFTPNATSTASIPRSPCPRSTRGPGVS